MYPLIEIKSVPIQIEMKLTHARLEYARGTADMQVSRDKGGLHIKSQPIRVNLDTFEARNSVVPTTATSIQQAAQKGRQAVYQATAAYAQQGRMMMETKVGEDVMGQIAASAGPGGPGCEPEHPVPAQGGARDQLAGGRNEHPVRDG